MIATTRHGDEHRSLHLGVLFAAAVIVGVAVWFAARAFAAGSCPEQDVLRVATSCRALVGSLAVRVGAVAGAAVVVMDLDVRRSAANRGIDGRGAPDRVPRTVVPVGRPHGIDRRLRGDTDAGTRLRRRPVHLGVRSSRIVREEVLRHRRDALARGRAPHRRRQDRDLRRVPGRAGGRGRSRLRRDPGGRAVRRRDREASVPRNTRRSPCRWRSRGWTSSTSSTATISAPTSSTSSPRSARSWSGSTPRATAR